MNPEGRVAWTPAQPIAQDSNALTARTGIPANDNVRYHIVRYRIGSPTLTHQLERDPLFLLYDVARLMRTRADQRARHIGMTRAQWVILAWLELQPGLSQNELAALVEVEPITVGRLVDRLEARGLVERRADPRDRRVKRLHLLPAVQPVLGEIRDYRRELTEQFEAALGREALEILTRSLLSMKGALLETSTETAAAE